MLGSFLKCGKLAIKFRGYEPQPVTPARIYRWVRQFEPEDRNAAFVLLDKVIYFDKRRVVKELIQLNQALHLRLTKSGISTQNIVYVHVDEPGSSSSMMIDLLHKYGPLRRTRCKWIDYSNQSAIIKAITGSKNEGVAIVYVDDFLGSGRQFCIARDFAAEFFPTAVPEFLLAPCLCEEAYSEVSKRDIEIFTAHIHTKNERPLHPHSFILRRDEKERLRKLGLSLSEKFGLGFGEMATMVAMYRNSPNNMPLLLRGSADQNNFVGILPRFSDLPPQEDIY